jgi:ribosomal protein S18 acetylase RimI-like enzyme
MVHFHSSPPRRKVAFIEPMECLAVTKLPDGAPNPVSLEFKDDDWTLAWVAVSDAKILGVIITNHEWVDDLWVLREHRRQGVGTRLLTQGESEIASRGCQTCRLRVVKSNLIAIQFYLRQGWQIAREFAHEKYHPMLEMAKSLPFLNKRNGSVSGKRVTRS